MDVLEKRFLAKVFKEESEDGCWIWVGAAPVRGGYGMMRVGNRSVRAHRISYEIYKGPITEGLIVCHKCDRPYCVRPEHLFLGTHADNTHDMIRKGRQGKVDPVLHAEISKAIWSSQSAEQRKARIEAVSRALKGKPFTSEHLANLRASPANQKGREVRFIPERKVPMHSILAILQKYAAGASQEDLAREYNVSREVISNITRDSFIEREFGYGTSQPSPLHEHGNTGVVRSEEQKTNHSETMKQRWLGLAPEQRKAWTEAQTQARNAARPPKPIVEKQPRKKRELTPEQRTAIGAKISASLTGKKLTLEHREKLRLAKLGKKRIHPQP